MSEWIELQWASGSLDEARKVCRYLVQEKLVACAQILPWIESIYLWNDALETSQESKVFCKLHLDNLSQVKDVIVTNCSYEVPEITWRALEGIHEPYLSWLKEVTPQNTKKT